MVATWTKLLILLLLYCVQGIPYGFQSRFLPIYLRTEGLSLTSLGFMKLLYLPWIIKTVWAPFVDSCGTKLKWLQGSISVITGACLALSFASSKDFTVLLGAILIMNFAASIQDIAVDAVALTCLSKDDLGIGNVAQVVGYKIGAVIGGGLLIALSQLLSWSSMFLFLVSVYIFSLAVISTSSMFRPPRQSSSSTASRPLDLKRYLASLKAVLAVPGTIEITVYLLTYKLCEVGCINMIPLYLVDVGHSMGSVGFWTGIIGQCASIAGSATGGWLLKYWLSSHKCLVSFATIRIPFISGLVLLVFIEKQYSFRFANSYFVLLNVLLFISGVMTTATFTMMMEASQHVRQNIQATYFTTLATLEVVGKLSFSIFSGALNDYLGYLNSFTLCSLFAFLTLYLLIRFRYSLCT